MARKGIKYTYEQTKLKRGFYVISVNGCRGIAEYTGDSWLPTGADYDPWQYGNDPTTIRVLYRIHFGHTVRLEVVK